jgi:hypothetical protein
MNRQEILVAAKAECLRSFALLMPALTKQSADALFVLAGHSRDYAHQRMLLDTYGTLLKRGPALRQRLEESLADLIIRGIKTAYRNERPSAGQSVSFDNLSLVESSTMDDEVKLGRVTNRFHEKSGPEIEQLNLRIASLFQQDTVKERENPFRPYLFSRCIASAVNELGLPPEASKVVIDQLVSELLAGVDDIYKSLNAFLEKVGVSTRLPATGRPQKSAAAGRGHPSETGGAIGMDNRGAQGSPHDASPARKAGHKVEQLLRIVRGGVGRGGGGGDVGGGGGGGGSTPGYGAGAFAAQGAPGAGGDGGSAYGGSGDAPPFLNTAELSEGWVSGKHIVGQALKKLFTPRTPQYSGSGGGAAATGRYPDYSPDAPIIPPENSVYHVLKATAVTSLQDVFDDDGEIRNLIFESRSALLSKASDGNEMMTIDVVGMIFEFILRDTEVPAEVRAQLGRLQFLLLKIALLDPQLLTEKTHPARKLINRIGTIAQGVKQNDPFGERLTEEIHRIVEELLADESDSIVLISRLLDEFEAFVAREFRSGDETIERAVEAIEEAEKRSAELARMTAQLKEALAVVKTEVHLQTFLEKTWLRAIEKADHDDPQLGSRYRNLVPELVWSILDKRTDQERSQLVSLLPKMVGDLKAGMDSVRAAEKQAFLGWLIDRHTHAIKAVGVPSKDLSLTLTRQQFESFTGGSASDQALDEVVFEFDRRFIDDAIAELKLQIKGVDSIPELSGDSDEQGAADPQGRHATAIEEDSLSEENVLNRLTVGVPVEIDFDGTPQRALLNWMNKRATNMLLSFEGKNVPTMITVALFRRLLANGRARFMEVAPLFERAITALLETADKVDEAYET